MNNYPICNGILARRSIRRFTDKRVEHDKIQLLLKAAMAAPSACNLQPWAFIVVDEPEITEALKASTSQGNYNAPLAIVVCGISKHIPWEGDAWMQDCGAAAQNIMLEAVELELGSVCIGGFDDEAVRKLLTIPADVLPLCIIELGYPAYTREPLSWYTQEAVHWQKYDENKPRILRTIAMLQEDAASGKL